MRGVLVAAGFPKSDDLKTLNPDGQEARGGMNITNLCYLNV